MENNLAIAAALVLVAIATVFGLVTKLLNGRTKRVSSQEQIDLGKLRAVKNDLPVTEFGKKATLLQFSTEYCGQCPGVRRSLAQLEYRHGGLLHLDVDITDRLDLAAHFAVSQTPTIFVLDPKGNITLKISGVPKPGTIQQELERLGAL